MSFSEWREVKLVEICDLITRGVTPAYTDKKDVIVINQKCIRNNIVTLKLARYTDSEKKKIPAQKYLHLKDILVNSTGVGTLGRVSQIKSIDSKMTVDSHVTIVRINNNECADFVGYNLIMQQPNIEALAEGSTGQTELSRTRLGEVIKILLPDFEKQKAIAATLSCIDDKIELNRKVNDNLADMAQAVFNSYYCQANKVVPFTSVIQILGGGTPKTGTTEFWNGNIPFFTPKDVGNPYVLTTEKNITESGLHNCNSRLYSENTVFVTARGTVGKVSLAGVPMAMNQSCYALVPHSGISQLLAYHMTLEIVKSLKHKASGAVFDAIVTRDFESESIGVLDAKQAVEFEKIVAPIYDEMLINCHQNMRLIDLRDTLLPRLMSGEINVSDL